MDRWAEDYPSTLKIKNDVAELCKVQGNDTKAQPLPIGAVGGHRLKLSDTHLHTIESWNNLIDLYEAWSKPEKANEWRAKLPQVVNISK